MREPLSIPEIAARSIQIAKRYARRFGLAPDARRVILSEEEDPILYEVRERTSDEARIGYRASTGEDVKRIVPVSALADGRVAIHAARRIRGRQIRQEVLQGLSNAA